MVLYILSSLHHASLLPLPLVKPGLVPPVDQPRRPRGEHLPDPDPLVADPLVRVVILHFKTLTDVATTVAAVSADGEQNVGALEVGAELEEVGALPLLQPEHQKEGSIISSGRPGCIQRSRPGDNLRYQISNIFDDNCCSELWPQLSITFV